MTNQELATFYSISTQAVGRWSKDRKHRKRVQALANAEQPICDLIADISKLVFIFNCKWLHGEKQVKCQRFEIDHDYVMIDGTEFWKSLYLHNTDVVEQLQSIRLKLEELVYGLQE